MSSLRRDDPHSARQTETEPVQRNLAALVERKPEEGDGKPTMGFVTDVGDTPRREKTARRVVEYGPYIPTLTKLLEDGYFD